VYIDKSYFSYFGETNYYIAVTDMTFLFERYQAQRIERIRDITACAT